jgi:SagB-type dehydrogenase family enzyme
MRSERLTTSPFLFGYRGRSGRLVMVDARAGTRFRLPDERAARMITDFIEPRSAAEGVAAGFSGDELDQADHAGILIGDRQREAIGLWERNGWSRPAYLLLSQMDIPYEDEVEADGAAALAAATAKRRSTVERYGASGERPERRSFGRGPSIALPIVDDIELRLSSLTSRRSVRAFSAVPPDVGQLAAVLKTATGALRSVIADRDAADPLGELNSFHSWAHLFIVIQQVDGVAAGAYEYDPARHVLVQCADSPERSALVGSVNGQGWVLGPGFVIFVAADFERYAWLYRHSRAYVHVLVQAGELGQELLMAATGAGLAGWTTPAVHESRAADLLGLSAEDGVEVLSLVKLGRPRC